VLRVWEFPAPAGLPPLSRRKPWNWLRTFVVPVSALADAFALKSRFEVAADGACDVENQLSLLAGDVGHRRLAVADAGLIAAVGVELDHHLCERLGDVASRRRLFERLRQVVRAGEYDSERLDRTDGLLRRVRIVRIGAVDVALRLIIDRQTKMLTPAEKQRFLKLDGKNIRIHAGDTVASAVFRSGIRVFSRSFKYHRRRGLYCLTGDCPNCMVRVDGEPCVRACMTPALPGQTVERESGWPSTDHDLLGVLDRAHRLLPVGFYYKTLLRPRWLWPFAEPLVRRVAGLGAIPRGGAPEHRYARHLHPDVLVIGGGVAGLAAALAAATAGNDVVLCDEGLLGERLAPGRAKERLEDLALEVRESESITVLEQTPAVGIYEGPMAVLNEKSFLHLVHPERIVVATGAVENHGVFAGNDLPGIWLSRGAARLAGVHGVTPGKRIVLVGQTPEAGEHADILRQAGAEVTMVADGEVIEANGRRGVKSVIVECSGKRERLRCDALVVGLGLTARDGLARQGHGLPVVSAGDAAQPGCSLEEAENSGRRAGLGETVQTSLPALPGPPRAGIVCLCEDVGVDELEHAWHEGFRSTEIMKRYTTATMGPCQGAMCHRHLRAFVEGRPGATGPAGGQTTARPPARGITLEQAAAGVHLEVHQRTALHERHLAHGAKMEPAGVWQRPQRYGELLDEYWAVRRGVSVMDVGTLGKYLVAGPDATEFVDRLYPCNVRDLEPGRFRYALLLGDNGYVLDDGIVCALENDRWYLTFTSSGASTAEAVLRDWAETWGLEIHLVNLTAAWGAINVAGPKSRELLQRLSDDPIDNETFPYLRHREITVAGVPCTAIRLGFVGELSYELHHDASRSVALWDALLSEGESLGIRPHGLDALRLLRLEKGHVIIGQDTDYDATPAKLNMSWATRFEKPSFLGKTSLERIAEQEIERKLVAVSFEGSPPPEGAALRVGGRYVGNLTSAAYSPVLDCGVGLGWIVRVNGVFPTKLETDDAVGTVVDHSFYDPKGELLRA
jgi:sarcosine oxidase, subunit alpha